MKRISRLLIAVFVILVVSCLTDSDSLNAKIKSKTVGSVKELEAELENESAEKIILKSDINGKLNIPVIDSARNKDLVINAPNASIINNSLYNSVTIKSALGYTENASGNSLTVNAKSISLNINKNVTVNEIFLTRKKAKVTLNADEGSFVSAVIKKKATLTIKGKLKDLVNVRSEATGSSVVTSVPVYLYADSNMKLSLKKGAIGSVVIYKNEDVNVKIKNKSGNEPEKIVLEQNVQKPDSDKNDTVDNTTFNGKKTSIKTKVKSVSAYTVYEEPSNVCQFKGPDGNFMFAIDGDKAVTVYKVKDGEVSKDKIELKKEHPKFGTVTCDEKGNFYLVTGENNPGETSYLTKTVFVSKFDSNGKFIKSNGVTGITGVTEDSFNTRYPFDGGNCSAAVMNDVIAVNYARGMYNGHQSNNMFAMNVNDLSVITIETFYNSHSFGQRTIALKGMNTFVFASHGDGFPRADRVNIMRMYNGKMCSYRDYELFHFWCPKEDSENNMYASMGGIAALSDYRVALVGESAVSLSEKAQKENWEIFIQIFNPMKDLYTESAYYTKGTRSGVTGIGDANRNYTDKGVKWLTNYGKEYYVSNVQLAATDDDRIVILYELLKADNADIEWPDYYNCKYQGVYYMILDGNGEILTDSTLYDSKAKLNPFEMPLYDNGKICWVGNKYDNEDRYNENNFDLYLYELNPGPAPEDLLKLNDTNVKEVVALDKAHFPDDIFRDYISATIDINNDMVLDEKEISYAVMLDFGKFKEIYHNDGLQIKSLKGIEYFTSLEYLDCYDNMLTELDVSKNTALKHLNCCKNKLSSLNLKNNEALEYLDCGENLFTSIDVSSNTKLDFLKCNENQLTYINVSKNTELTVLHCGGNNLQGIDVRNNKKLKEINCACNWGITEIDVSQNTDLEVLVCYCASIKKIDVRNNKELYNLNFGINQVSEVDLRNNPKIEFLGCCCNNFTNIDLSHTPLLKVLELSENKLTRLDLSNNPLLERLYVDKNSLTSLNLSNNTELEFINCKENPLMSLDLSNNLKLQDDIEYDAGLRIIR